MLIDVTFQTLVMQTYVESERQAKVTWITTPMIAINIAMCQCAHIFNYVDIRKYIVTEPMLLIPYREVFAEPLLHHRDICCRGMCTYMA